MIRCLLLFCVISFTPIIYGQNPFDIKKPIPGKTAPIVKKEEVKKQEPKPQVIAPPDTPAKPIQQVQTVPPAQQPSVKPAGESSLIEMLDLDKKSNSSTNIFDIKTPKGKEANKPVILNSPSSRSAEVSTKTATPNTAIVEKTNPDSISATSDKSFIDIIPPSEQTDIKELKKELKSFSTASTNDHGEISKNAWFIIYIFLFLLAAIAINFNRSYPGLLLKATYNQNQLRILFKDAFKGNHMLIFGILYFLFIINAGIFIYQSFKLFNVAALSLFWSILIVILVYLVRHLVLYIMGKVFPMEKEAMFFNYTIGIHNLTAGLGLMLINILLSFIAPETGKMLIFSGIGIIIALYAMRQVRGLLNNIPVIVSRKLHFIIYLCAVEIAPWMILVRYFTT